MEMFTVVGVVSVIIYSVHGQEIPEYIKPCPKEDTEFNTCAKEHGTEAIPFIVEGDENFNIPNMKPLKIPEIVIPSDNSLGLNIKFTDCEIYGLELAEIKDINMDFEKNHASITLHIENINVQGNYDVSGRILLLPINGNGKSNVTYVNGDYTFEIDWTTEARDGEEYAKITEHKMDYQVKRAYYHLDNLFNGNQFLGDRMNNFLDINWKEVSKIIGPSVTEVVGGLVKDILNDFLEKIPFSKLFA